MLSTRLLAAVALSTLATITGCSKVAASQTEPPKNGSAESPGSEQALAAPATADVEKIAVVVNEDGFSPNHVQLKRNSKATLQFRRTSDQTCAKQVAFPELGVTKELPLNQVVSLDVPTDQSRSLTFQCGMGMYKSKIVVL